VVGVRRLAELAAHCGDGFFIVARIEDRRAGHEHIRTRRGYFANIVHADSAINLQANVMAAFIDQLAHLRELAQRRGNKLLAAKARVHRHQQDHIELIHEVFETVQRRGGIKHQARFAAVVAD